MTIKFRFEFWFRNSLGTEIRRVVDRIVPRMFSSIELVDLCMNIYVPERLALDVIRALNSDIFMSDFNPGEQRPITIVEVIGE